MAKSFASEYIFVIVFVYKILSAFNLHVDCSAFPKKYGKKLSNWSNMQRMCSS